MHTRKENRTYYVVVHGRKPGIYKNNRQALSQVHGFPSGKMKKIKGLQAAKAYFADNRQSNAQNRIYYVVKRGRNPGLYLNKEKALQQIKNYPYGKMKRIKGYDRARRYFHGESLPEKEQIPFIFIDGSYLQHEPFSGYGFIVVENDQIIAKDSGTIFDYDIINLHSSGAELYAFIRAIEWAMANSYKYIRVIYDSQSIVQLLNNDESLSTKQPRGKVKITKVFSQYKNYITIDHEHKNNTKKYEIYHRQAHDLSRSMIHLLQRKE